MMHHHQKIIHFIPSIPPFACHFYTCKELANGCNPGNPGQAGCDNWCCNNPDGSSGYSGRLSWDPLTVFIAVRGFEASHMATLSNVTIDVSYSGGEVQTATHSSFSNSQSVRRLGGGWWRISGFDVAPARAYCCKFGAAPAPRAPSAGRVRDRI